MDGRTEGRRKGEREKERGGDACIIYLLFNKWMDMFIDT